MRPTDANNKTHYKNGLENWYRGKRHHFSWGAVQFDAEPSYFIETSTLLEIFVQIFVRFFHAPFFFEDFTIFLLLLDIKYKFHRNYTNFRIKIDDIEFGMVFLSHCHFLVDVANYTTAGSVPQHIRYDEMGIGDDSKKYDINGKTN